MEKAREALRENTRKSEPEITAKNINKIPSMLFSPVVVFVFIAMYITPMMPKPKKNFCPKVVFSFNIRASKMQQETGISERMTPEVIPVVMAIPNVSKSMYKTGSKIAVPSKILIESDLLFFTKKIFYTYVDFNGF